MVSKKFHFLLFVLTLLYNCELTSTITSESLQLSSSRYNNCGRYECPAGGKFKFASDVQYTYIYTLNINSSFDGESKYNSNLTLSFKIDIKIRECEGVMRVKGNRQKEGFDIFEEDGIDNIYSDVNKYLLSFSFYDGAISNVCPSEKESVLSLNLKKGILTAFQNKMKRFDIDRFISEKDVNGYCPTRYNLESVNGTTLVIRKFKDISGCAERYQLHSILPTSRYVFQSKYNKWAPLNSTAVCHQTIDHGIPIKIQCQEEHTLKLLTNQTYNSKTIISQNFDLISEVASYSDFFNQLYYPDDILIREGLTFDHKKPKKSAVSELAESQQLLIQLCSITSNDFHQDAASIFTKFIHTARHLSFYALRQLLKESSDLCSTGRTHVQDSLPFLRSTAAVSLMKDIIIRGNISESTANGWLLAISLFSRPDEDVIESVTPLLLEDSSSTNVLLSISSVIHSYCSWTSNCEEQEIILDTMIYLEQSLNETLDLGNDWDKAIVLLKSLGNAGYKTDSIGFTLASCILNPTVTDEIRMAAIEAHRRLPCNFNFDFLLNTFLNVEHAAEVRISAYLQVMKCPSYGAVKRIKQVLENENVNQVAAFVWSHLKNIMKSSLPTRIEIQSILQDYQLQRKFQTDFRKFSQNYESSFYFSDNGIGGYLVSNVIFSTKTYIPRMLTFNVTFNIFGETINVFEIDVFLEGFESYVESVFKQGVSSFINDLEKKISAYRFFRSLPTAVKDLIKLLPNNIIGNFPDPVVSFSIKIFGKELKYKSYRGKEKIHEALENFSLSNIIRKFLSGQELKYDYSTVFMDISYVSPTSAGIPLNLDAVGILITNFDTLVFVDAEEFSSSQILTIDGKLKPRFSINFEGTMGTDLVYEQTQVQLKSKIFTSSAIEGKLLVNGYDNITLTFNLPMTKFDIFSLQTDLYYKDNFKHEDIMVVEEAVSNNQIVCFWPLLDQTIGLKVCSNYFVSNSTHILESISQMTKGPFKFSLFIEKSDPSAKNYIMNYRKIAHGSNQSITLLEFETPNSVVKRYLKAELYSDPEGNNFTVYIQANQTELETHGIYKYTPTDKVLNFELEINKQKHIEVILELHTKQDKRATIYSPKLYFGISSKPVAELSGTYRCVEKKGVSQCDIDLQFKTNKFDSNITGYVMNSEGAASTNVHIQYKFEKTNVEGLKFEAKYNDKSTKTTAIIASSLQLESTTYPVVNFRISLDYKKSHEHTDVRVDYISNPYVEDDRQKMMIQLVFTHFKSFNGMKMDTYVEIRKVITDVNFKVGLTHQENPSGSNTVVMVRYATGKDIVVRLEIDAPPGTHYYYELKLNTTLPTVQQPMIVHIRIIEKYEKEYDIDFSGTWFSGHTAMAKGLFQDKSTHYLNNYYIKLQVRSRIFSEVLLSAKLTYNEYEHKLVMGIDHNNIKYAILCRHLTSGIDSYETYLELVYNNSGTYYINNRIDLSQKELIAELHLDKYRDVHVALRGALRKWNSNVGLEFKWDANRDPSQKIVFNFNTKSESISDGTKYSARFIVEYPGHISAAYMILQNIGKYHSFSAALELSASSAIEILAYSQNELLSKGIAQMGFKLLTPFENWRETAISLRMHNEKQSFQTNGSLVWQGNQSIVFDAHGGYLLEENVTSFLLSSFLNSTLQDLSSLSFNVNYRRIPNEIHISFLLQPNIKYSLFVSTSGVVNHYDNADEYIWTFATRTPFLEYVETEVKFQLKLMDANRINSDTSLRLNDKLYALRVKGILSLFDKTKLCLYVTTPYEKYKSVNGLIFYDPENKLIFLNLTSSHINIKADIVYLYNNLSNFHLKLHLITPMSYLNNLLVVGKYNGKALDLRCGWNTFILGFSGVSYFHTWNDLEYQIHLFTPIETFRESSAVLKVFLDAKIIVTARAALSSTSKAGFNLEYDSEKSKVWYLDECDNYYDKDTPGIYKSVVLKNGLFELDTLIYSTIKAMFIIRQTDTRYTLDVELWILFLKVRLMDQLDYENTFCMNNTLSMQTSIDMLSEVNAYVTIKNVTENAVNSSIDVSVLSFNSRLNGGIDVVFKYQPSTRESELSRYFKSKHDGTYVLDIVLKTPFEQLEKGEIKVDFHLHNDIYDFHANIATNDTLVTLKGTLLIVENYFNLCIGFNLSSSYLNLPMFKLLLVRDFSKLQKQILFSIQEPSTDNKFNEIFGMRSIWYIDNRNYINLSGELKSPFKILDELKASLHYSHEAGAESYYLEAYMKYSNKTEMKARANLRPPNVTLNLESSMEGLRNAHFVGKLERTGPGQQKIDAVMINNNNFRIRGSSSVSDLTPFAITGKLLRTKETERETELSSVSMNVRKKEGGYTASALLNSKGKALNVETEITDHANNSRIINLKIMTSRAEAESLIVNAKLLLQHPGLYVLTVKGESETDGIKASSVSELEIWFRNSTAAVFASLESSIISGKAELFTFWKPNNIYGATKVNYQLQKQTVELINSKLFFIRKPEAVNNITTGVMIDLNQKWKMEANFTLMIKAVNDTMLVSHLLLPNKDAYYIAGLLQFQKTYNFFQHLLVYARPKDTPCFTVSDINLISRNVKGVVAFKCGIKDSIYMFDNFEGRKSDKMLTLNNYIRSNTLSNSFVSNIRYKKPNTSHIINLRFYCPPTKLISTLDVKFESTDNFDCFVNTTTPFITVPYLAFEVKSITEPYFYQRYGKVYLHNKPALFNITHVRTKNEKSLLNDGQITLLFPVATWHEAILSYTYEDKLAFINGSSELMYNKERVLTGNFTRNITIIDLMNDEFIHIELGNSLMPLGVNYFNKQNGSHHLYNFKRTEIYKLANSSAINITGEMLVENVDSQEWTTFRVLNLNRSIVLRSYTDGYDLYENSIYAKLKQEIWFNYGLRTIRHVTNYTSAKTYDLSISYPRRNFSLVSDFNSDNKNFIAHFTVHNYLAIPKKAIGVRIQTKKISNTHQQSSVVLFHPSFQKNVTLFISFSYTRALHADMKIVFEYSDDVNRKLTLTGTVDNKSTKGNRNYTLFVTGKHPASKFKLDISAAVKSEIGLHFIGNNVTYRRSYLPEHYWFGKAVLNTKDFMLEIERMSLRGQILLYGDYKNTNSCYIVNTIIAEGISTNISGHFEVDLLNKETHCLVNLTSDISDTLQIEGNVPENREAKFNVWRTYNDLVFPQISFYVALNHSRLLSSALLWRTDIGNNILRNVRSAISYLWVSAQDSIELWTHFIRSEASDTVADVWNDAKPLMQDFLEDVNNIKTIQDNINYFKSVLNDSYNANEFFLRDIHEFYNLLTQEMSFIDKLGSVPKIVNEIWSSMGETGQVIRKSLIWIVNTVKELYEELMSILDDLVEGKAEMYVSKFIRKLTEKFDNFIKDLHITFISSTESAINEIISVLTHYWKKIMLIFEPTFIEILHHIDSTFWASTRKLIDFIYARRDELLNSQYFLRSANLTQKLDAIYKDFSKNDLVTNIKKYFNVISNVVYEHYFSQIPYRQELQSIGNEIIGEVNELYKLPLIAYTVDNIKLMYNQAVWVYEYFDVTNAVQKLIPYLYRQIYENTFTALEFELRNHKPKTKFVFDPENGVVKLEQKLPFPWHAFNETPIYEELAEYKQLQKYRTFFSSTSLKFWSIYKTALLLMDPQSWIPPFNDYAFIIGLHNYISFDSRHVPFYGNSCRYLLSHDFVDGAFSVVLNNEEKGLQEYQSISILIGDEMITIDLVHKRISVESKQTTTLPLQLNTTYVYYDQEVITVKNTEKGITLECNMYYGMCTLHVSGWYFGKLSGIMGTMNNEPSDDLIASNKSVGFHEKYDSYLWPLSLNEETCPQTGISYTKFDYVNEICSRLFLNTSSTFEPCFSEVDPLPFYSACAAKLEEENTCSSAMAYVQSCSFNGVPLKMPTFCVKCSFPNNRKVEEGTFIHIEDSSFPHTSDIVFIVEAKPCNKDILVNKNFNLLLPTISKELSNYGVSSVRYALITFGGDGVYSNPHNVHFNGHLFSSNMSTFTQFFENIPTGNGSTDAFSAIRFATKLSFSTGASKTIILVLCSTCDPSTMELDYSVLHHALTEKSITLHILMNDDFPADKSRSGKVLFGIDGPTAYTKSDFKLLKGDTDLRKQIKLTKSMLGYCTPLALESGGSLFTAQKLSNENTNLMKKFVSTFSKRVALSAKPNSCQNCECHSDVNGVPFVDCISCFYLTPVNFDFGIEDDMEFPVILNFNPRFINDNVEV